jgi:hypothetical protein
VINYLGLVEDRFVKYFVVVGSSFEVDSSFQVIE